jgi:hypothetical protein
MIGHILIWYYHPFIGIIILGAAYAITFTAVWTGVIYLINAEFYGKSYSIIIGLYNTGFTFVPLLVGLLRSYTGNYFYSQIMLSILGSSGLLLGIMIYQEDKKVGYKIDGLS